MMRKGRKRERGSEEFEIKEGESVRERETKGEKRKPALL